MNCCVRAERELEILFQREVRMDVIRQIVDLARQAAAATDRLTRLRLILQIVVIAAKAGIDLSGLFGGTALAALAGARAPGPASTADAVAAVVDLETQALPQEGCGDAPAPEAARGGVGGILPSLGDLVVRVLVELVRLVLQG